MRINNIRTKTIFKLNKKESNIEKKIIEEYSDKKNKTKPPLPYSTLNPEISSLSPSEKSNGARFVSATITKIQPNTTIFWTSWGQTTNQSQSFMWE